MKLLVDELAGRLDLPPNTLDRWIRQGRIPVQKRGDSCIFEDSVLVNWAKMHGLTFSHPKDSGKAFAGSEPVLEDLVPCMKRGGVFHDIDGSDKEKLLASAVAKIPHISDERKKKLLKDLLERERMNPTGVGKGIAIPHPRSPLTDSSEKPFITTCFPKEPIDFGAIDGLPVFILFILSSPSVKNHLHLLSRLSFCARDNDFLGFLKTKPDADELISRIGDFESRLGKSR